MFWILLLKFVFWILANNVKFFNNWFWGVWFWFFKFWLVEFLVDCSINFNKGLFTKDSNWLFISLLFKFFELFWFFEFSFKLLLLLFLFFFFFAWRSYSFSSSKIFILIIFSFNFIWFTKSWIFWEFYYKSFIFFCKFKSL